MFTTLLLSPTPSLPLSFPPPTTPLPAGSSGAGEGFEGSSGAGGGFEVTKFGHGQVALIGFPSVGKSTLLTVLTGTRSEAAANEFTTQEEGSSGAGEGFEVTKFGHGRVALIGFPSVGKSTLLTVLTGTRSEAAAYEFTTLTCIPGIINYNDTKIQLLDLPGIIEGASQGKGRGRQVIAVAKSSDLVLMVLDASKSDAHRQILTKELESVGLRLNKQPPNIYFKKKKTGGISFNSTGPLTHIDEKLCYQILHEYKIHNAEVLFREDSTVDDLIDVIEGNRKYIRCLYVYNKIDVMGIDDVDRLARQPHSVVISANLELNMDHLLARMWEEMGLVRVYTKPQGQQPDFADPVVLSTDRGGCTVRDFCDHIHRGLLKDVKYVLCWGISVKHYPQRCGLAHVLRDEDVVQIVKKKVMCFLDSIWMLRVC
ncbi:unnamed protein product [Closterium sp. NIES-64]|nr:unnamed protein product [Closterium sp. NIES-64]